MTTWSLFATGPMTSGDNNGWSEAFLTSARVVRNALDPSTGGADDLNSLPLAR